MRKGLSSHIAYGGGEGSDGGLNVRVLRTHRWGMKRLLLVDDSPDFRSLLRLRLEDRFEIVGELSDGWAAASEVEETKPDVIVMDLRMPILNGDEATRHVKALYPHVHVIGFTSEDEACERMTEAGADAAFSKTDFQELLDHLEGLATD